MRDAERPDLSILTPEERELHDHVLALRNKHFAHSVNGYEDSVTFAFLSANPFLAKRVTRVGQSHLTLYTADPELVSGLRSVAIRFERTLYLRVRELNRQIGDELARLDIDDIYRMPDLSAEPPTRARSTGVGDARIRCRSTNRSDDTTPSGDSRRQTVGRL